MSSGSGIDEVRTWLRDIPELCALLPDAAATRTAIEGPRPAPGSRPPVRLDVLHLLDGRDKHRDANMATCDPDRQGVLPYLFGWVRDIEADALDQSPELPPEAPEVPTVAGCCAWLTAMLPFAATLPQWFELADGIKVVHSRLRSATAGVRDVEQRPVPCTRCKVGRLELAGPKLWQCDECGWEFTVQAVSLPDAHRALRALHHDKAPTLRTLQNWATRPGLLPGLLESGPRTRVYDMATIHALTSEYLLTKGA